MIKKPSVRSLIGVIGFILLFIGLWKFKTLVGLMLVSVALSFIGRPIVLLIDRIQIKGRKLPKSVGAIIALVTLMFTGIGVVQLFVPLVSEQAKTVERLDTEQLKQFAGKGLNWLDQTMAPINLSGDERRNSDFVLDTIQSSLEFREIGGTISQLLSSIGDLLFGLFSITFMTFFFLKDGALFRTMIESITPDELTPKVNSIVDRTSRLLTRYFGGLVIQLIIITTVVSVGLQIVGVQHAFLIGLLAGFCNLVPYLGPLAGAAIGITLALATATGDATSLTGMFWGSLLVFAAAQLVDNFFTQPVIFANRVHAHPLEIFLVITIAGGLGGVIGMILAVPIYTLFRIVAQELFSGFKLVDRLTQNLR